LYRGPAEVARVVLPVATRSRHAWLIAVAAADMRVHHRSILPDKTLPFCPRRST